MRLKIDQSDAGLPRLAEDDPLPPEDRRKSRRSDWLDDLYRKHRGRLMRFARRHVPAEHASDIVQQIFLRLAGQGDRQSCDIEKPDAFLRQAARNLIRDEARASHRKSAGLHVCADDVPLAGHDPVAALEARDMVHRLEQAVARLEPRTREIFLAHRIDGLSYREIAAHTGLSIKTVEKHMSRAIAFVARQVEA
ncbi:RNA polymerase sigma factor [Novosphingobium naphthalenivorans]|uniref:RNA polymerase sigma factor n=1 Tax=Novosphingobium naphthalenivorans TaxID=273168 RepID=UPI00082D10A3|nr:sigma-70 family RNA polymerase sigma factor [Novosphingobium naphthalenivorans]